jgi:hypothetical protein
MPPTRIEEGAVEARSFPRDVVPLLAGSMAIFVITVVLGILNGTDLVDLPHGVLLAHVHSGTLGWITLSIFAAAAWIFDTATMPRLLRDGSIAAVALYVAAFWADITSLRPVAGTLMLIAIVWFAVWVFQARGDREASIARLSMVLASVNLTIGGVLGVLLGLMLAGALDPSEGIAGAHPAMMVVGYLILAGVALDEQLLVGDEAVGVRAGAWQAWLFFVAGIALAVGVLFDLQPLLGLNLLGEVIGVVLVLVRLGRRIAGAGWSAVSAARHGAISVLWLIPALALLAYLIVRYIDDVEAAPRGLFLALDHATFVGVLTNGILGLLLVATAKRRSLWSWADQLVFWGVNLGLAVFVVGLIAEVAEIKRIGTPIMGASILLGLLTATVRLRAPEEGAAAAAA